MGTRYRAFTQERHSPELTRKLVYASRQEEQLTRVLAPFVGNKYDEVIFLMSGTTRTFYGGRDEKKGNQILHDKCDGHPWEMNNF